MTAPISNVSAAPSTSVADSTETAAAPAFATSPEEALALAALSVEESVDRARQSRVSERQTRSARKRAAIASRREAANWQMASGIVGGASKAGGGIFNAAGNKEAGAGVAGLGEIGSTVLNRQAAVARTEAELHDLAATEAGERAQDAEAHAEALLRHQGKAMQGAQDAARTAHESMMASIRA